MSDIDETQADSLEPSASQKLWPVESILDEKGAKYLVAWEGEDPDTGERWKPTWELKNCATDALVAAWEDTKKERRSLTPKQRQLAQKAALARVVLQVESDSEPEPPTQVNPIPDETYQDDSSSQETAPLKITGTNKTKRKLRVPSSPLIVEEVPKRATKQTVTFALPPLAPTSPANDPSTDQVQVIEMDESDSLEVMPVVPTHSSGESGQSTGSISIVPDSQPLGELVGLEEPSSLPLVEEATQEQEQMDMGGMEEGDFNFPFPSSNVEAATPPLPLPDAPAVPSDPTPAVPPRVLHPVPVLQPEIFDIPSDMSTQNDPILDSSPPKKMHAFPLATSAKPQLLMRRAEDAIVPIVDRPGRGGPFSPVEPLVTRPAPPVSDLSRQASLVEGGTTLDSQGSSESAESRLEGKAGGVEVWAEREDADMVNEFLDEAYYDEGMGGQSQGDMPDFGGAEGSDQQAAGPVLPEQSAAVISAKRPLATEDSSQPLNEAEPKRARLDDTQGVVEPALGGAAVDVTVEADQQEQAKEKEKSPTSTPPESSALQPPAQLLAQVAPPSTQPSYLSSPFASQLSNHQPTFLRSPPLLPEEPVTVPNSPARHVASSDSIIAAIEASPFILDADSTKAELIRYVSSRDTYPSDPDAPLLKREEWSFGIHRAEKGGLGLLVVRPREGALKLSIVLESGMATAGVSLSIMHDRTWTAGEVITQKAALELEVASLKSTLQAQSDELVTLRPLSVTVESLISNLERAKRNLASKAEELDFMTSSYQSASSAAFDRATECRIAEEEVERLKGQLDLGMKQRDLFLEAVSAKDKGELRKMKEELSMALELNRRTQGLRKKASLWESYLAEKEAREEEEEKRAEEEALKREKADKMRRAMLPDEEDMEERRRAAMALDAGMDTESSDYDSEDGYVNDPDVFRCLWRPGCDHLFPSRLVLEEHLIAAHVLPAIGE